jgi:ADP-ribose pyrophosphatase YjhB (NUDIX family)
VFRLGGAVAFVASGGPSPLYDLVMSTAVPPFDYHGALVVVETGDDEIVFIHPPGGSPEAPASLPSNPCDRDETPEDAAVRMVREMTGLEATIVREFATFIQEGTPTGTMFAHCYIAHVTGGELIHGPEGPARAYPLDALPMIMPIRVANQRALDAYLKQRGKA